MLNDWLFIPREYPEKRQSFFEQQVLYEMLGKRNDDFIFEFNKGDSMNSSFMSTTASSPEFINDPLNDKNKKDNSFAFLTTPNEPPETIKKKIIIYKDDDSDEDSIPSDDEDGNHLHRNRKNRKDQIEDLDRSNAPKVFWSQEEDDLLIEKVKEVGHCWSYISKFFPNRKPTNIMTHYKNMVAHKLTKEELDLIAAKDLDSPYKQTKKAWTEEEERLLTEKVQEYGNNWVKIKQFFPNRTESSISLHYSQRKKKQGITTYKTDDSKPNSWTEQEDELLISLLKEHGVRWAAIVPHFPNRSVNGISQHWNSRLRSTLSIDDLNLIMGKTNPNFKIVWHDGDDQLLADKVREYNQNWDEIMKFFPDTDLKFLKDRWITHGRLL